MSRPTSRAQLLTAATDEFERLLAAVDLVAPDDRERPGACEAWSVKDLLAHLHAWHLMLLSWESEGRRGDRPTIPAVGFTWAETPALNDLIYRRHRDDGWDDVVAALDASHRRVLEVIGSYDDPDLFAKRRYAWTGTTSAGSYLVSATSSHYAWAATLIRRWAKRQRVQAVG